MAMAASTSRIFSFIFILLFAQLAARVIWIAAVVVAGKVGLIPAAVEVFGSHVVKVCFVELHGDLLKVGAEAPWG
jgi:hypothetical protein